MSARIEAWALVWSDLGLCRVTTDGDNAKRAVAAHSGLRAVHLIPATDLARVVTALRELDAALQAANIDCASGGKRLTEAANAASALLAEVDR